MPDAPAANPPSNPSPTTPPPSPPSVANFDKHFSDLEDGPPTGTPPNAETTSKPTGPSSEPSSDKPTDKPGDKPASKPQTPPETDDQEPPAQGKASDLRNWGKRQMEKAKKLDGELKALKAKLAEVEQQKPEGDAKVLAEELANTKKRLEEYEGNLRLVKYERSQEYDEKYRKPYQKAIQTAYADLGELTVQTVNPETEEVTERPATQADFDEIYSLPLAQATKLAKQKFGDLASIVLGHRSTIKNLAKAAVDAIEEHKGKAVEQEKQMTAQQAAQQQQRLAMWQKVNEELETKYSKWFGKHDGDEEWNTALAKGREIADLAFSDRQGLSPQQNVVLDAQIRHRASAFPALKVRVTKLEGELAAAQKTIEELRGSSPGKPKPSSEAPAGKETWEQGIDRLPE